MPNLHPRMTTTGTDETWIWQAFDRWVAAAAPGAVTAYHASLHGSHLGLVGAAAWEACQRGLVLLVQERMQDQTIRYLAVRASTAFSTPPRAGSAPKRKAMED